MKNAKEKLIDIRGEVEGSNILDTILFCFNEYEEYLSKEDIKNEIISTVTDMIECCLIEREL